MDIVHIKVVFRDAFSGATMTKFVTKPVDMFEKMKKGIGTSCPQFDGNINWDWVVESVEQIKQEDYETA